MNNFKEVRRYFNEHRFQVATILAISLLAMGKISEAHSPGLEPILQTAARLVIQSATYVPNGAVRMLATSDRPVDMAHCEGVVKSAIENLHVGVNNSARIDFQWPPGCTQGRAPGEACEFVVDQVVPPFAQLEHFIIDVTGRTQHQSGSLSAIWLHCTDLGGITDQTVIPVIHQIWQGLLPFISR